MIIRNLLGEKNALYTFFSVPMNKIKVGMTSSPNLKKVQSKVGSLSNASYRPGGGEFKIKSQKLDWKAQPRTRAFNDGYTPKGGDKKVPFQLEFQ